MNGHQFLEPEKRQEGIDRLLDYLKGGAPPQNLIETFSDLNFSELESEVRTAIGESTPENRAELHFKLALIRSLRYSVANARHCFVLGAVNGIRELHEGQRLMQQYEPGE